MECPSQQNQTGKFKVRSIYVLFVDADSFGVGTVPLRLPSSSTIAQPRNLIECKAAITAGKSTVPWPNSVNSYPAGSDDGFTSFKCKQISRSAYFLTAAAGSPPPC